MKRDKYRILPGKIKKDHRFDGSVKATKERTLKELGNYPEDRLNDILGEFFSSKLMNRSLMQGKSVIVPQRISIRIAVTHVARVKAEYEAKLAADAKKVRVIDDKPKYYAMINRCHGLYTINKWRKINGLEPLKRFNINGIPGGKKKIPWLSRLMRLYPDFFPDRTPEILFKHGKSY